MDLVEIFKAWKNVLFTDEEKEAIAKERLAVCNKCPFKDRMLKVDVCGICHCPLLGKTHSEENSCPKKLWPK